MDFKELPMRSTRTRRPGLRVGRRGLTIIEGLMSSVILLLGMLGIIRGIIVASQQNAMANQMTRAGAITSQVRVGLENQGRDRLINGPLPLFAAANCIAPNTPAAALAGGLESMTLATDVAAGWTRLCIVDFDAVDDARAANEKLVAGYAPDDRAFYRRFVVLFQTNDTVTDSESGDVRTVRANQVAIVVSWMAAGQRVFSRRFVGFYDSGSTNGNSTRIDI
jgi:hypothetical protein